MKTGSWLVALSAVVALAMIPGMAGAQAVVIKDSSCTFLRFDEQLQALQLFEVTGGLEDLNSIKVVTPSANCNRNVSCHTNIDSLGQAYSFDFDSPHHGTGLMCSVRFEYIDADDVYHNYVLETENWHETITPKGNVSLTCHFKDCDQSTIPK